MSSTVGVDVGGTNIKAVLLSDGGEILARRRSPTPTDATAMIDAVEAIARSLAPGRPLGVGLAGLVDHRRGSLVWAPHLPGEQVDVAATLAARLNVAVTVDNDANLAALAEHRHGAGQGTDALVMVTLGTGIGMGIVLDGEIYRGLAHAGEVGHITVAPEGRLCSCGRRGCWETTVSGQALDMEAVAILGPEATAADLVVAAADGNIAARRAVALAGSWLARGIETIVLALDPEVVVVGGAAAGAGALLLDPVRDLLSRTEGAGHRALARVVAGSLGAEAGAIGAAIAAG